MARSKVLLTCLICLPNVVQAEMPIFQAECLQNLIESDSAGVVRANGAPTEVKKFNDNYYEASIESLTFSISHDGGGKGLIVSFTGSEGVNGICQVLSVELAKGVPAEAGPMEPGETRTEKVRFQKGASSATVTADISPGGSVRYVLGANSGQFLSVTMGTATDAVSYQIFNPDDSFLLDMVPFTTNYEGQLWQSGDHVVEVINRSNESAYVTVTMAID